MGKGKSIEPGDQFGLLTVLKLDHVTHSGKMWLCRCDCGNEKVIYHTSLTAGRTKSCGCQMGPVTHAMSYSTEYHRWQQMKARCLNPKHPSYKDYGERGVRVCKRWLEFENFYADMGPCPPGLTLERKNNNGHYTPKNCHWATRADQARNYSRNVWITWQGMTKCIKDWNAHFGLKPNVLASRLKRHSVAEVFDELRKGKCRG